MGCRAFRSDPRCTTCSPGRNTPRPCFEMKRQGAVRYVGITSHGPAARRAEARSCAPGRSISCRRPYNIRDREVEQRILRWRERGITFIANRPFRRGELIDRVKAPPTATLGSGQAIDRCDWAAFRSSFIVSSRCHLCDSGHHPDRHLTGEHGGDARDARRTLDTPADDRSRGPVMGVGRAIRCPTWCCSRRRPMSAPERQCGDLAPQLPCIGNCRGCCC